MSRKIFLLVAGLAFLSGLISMFFGASIYNANENHLINHLNEMDRLDYFDADEVPKLSALAALISMPFSLAIVILEIYILKKSPVPQVKRIGIAVIAIQFAILVLASLTINNPHFFDFSKWGFAWIFAALFTVAGNALCIFLKPKSA